MLSRVFPKTYVLEVRLTSDQADHDVMHQFELPRVYTLNSLAIAIINAYEFEMDKCYGFYDHMEDFGYVGEATRSYKLFADLKRKDGTPSRKPGVENIMLSKLWDKIGSIWYFLYDYNDNWTFAIELIKTNKVQFDVEYPQIVGQEGKAPNQYGELEEDYDDFEDHFDDDYQEQSP